MASTFLRALVAFCQRSDAVFEPIYGLISDSKTVVPKVKPEKLETLIEVPRPFVLVSLRESFSFPSTSVTYAKAS